MALNTNPFGLPDKPLSRFSSRKRQAKPRIPASETATGKFLGSVKNFFTKDRTPARPATPREPLGKRLFGDMQTISKGGFTLPAAPFGATPTNPSAPTITPDPNQFKAPIGPPRPPQAQDAGFASKQALPQVNKPSAPIPTPTPTPVATPATTSGLSEAEALVIQGATEAPQADKPAIPTISPETKTAVKTAEDALATASVISPEELSTQADLDRLIESAKKSYQSINDQPIPLEFITGQLKSVENRALNLAEPLENKLARLQAKRTSAVEASKFSLTRVDKQASAATKASSEAETKKESARRFDLQQTGLQETRDLAQAKFDENIRQFGLNFAQTQNKLDAADAKAEETGSTADISNALNEKINFIKEIESHSGLNSRVGPSTFARRTFAAADKFGAGQDFAGSIHQLSSQEFLDKLIAVKAKGATFGALNQSEADSLRAAATKINDWELKDENGLGIGEWNIDEKSFKKELGKLKRLAQKAMNKATTGSVTGGNTFVAPDGIEVEIID